MSTRSIVGRVAGDGFEGRYVHSDGYPTERGPILWAWVRSHLADRDALRGELDAFVDDHEGYSYLETASFGLRAVCYCHDRSEGLRGDQPLTAADPPSTSDAEYVWVVDAEAATLALLVPEGGSWSLRFVWHVDDEEPDWAEVERRARA